MHFWSDSGDELNNYDFQEISENLNVEMATVIAESPWSNGIVERHDAVVGNMVHKIIADTDCSLEIALV